MTLTKLRLSFNCHMEKQCVPPFPTTSPPSLIILTSYSHWCPSIFYYSPLSQNPHYLLPSVSLHFLIYAPPSESFLFTPTCVKQCIPPFPTTYPLPQDHYYLIPHALVHFLLHPPSLRILNTYHHRCPSISYYTPPPFSFRILTT